MINYNHIKRFLDIIISFIALVILSPVFLIISLLILIESRRPIIFTQERLGKNGKVFKIYKFRTMVVGAINMGKGLRTDEDDKRITKIGKILRKTSLDELPQLINVLKGDMSIIGPRPPVPYHPYKYEDYDSTQKKRFLIRPGITGYAQVMVRNAATWDERIKYDVYYYENLNFLFDIKIFLKTIKTVLSRKNIYPDKKENLPEQAQMKVS